MKRGHINVVAPEFERPATEPKPTAPPQNAAAWHALRRCSLGELRARGLRAWDEPDAQGMVLMLFPFEWLDAVPQGLAVVTVSGQRRNFDHRTFVADKRAGVLPFGVLVKARTA